MMTRSQALKEVVAYAIDQQREQLDAVRGGRTLVIRVQFDRFGLPATVLMNEESAVEVGDHVRDRMRPKHASA